MNREIIIGELEQAIEQIQKQLDTLELEKTGKSGIQITFNEIENELDNIKKIINVIEKTNYDLLPLKAIEINRTRITDLNNFLQNIRGFNANAPNAMQEKIRLINEVEQRSYDLYQTASCVFNSQYMDQFGEVDSSLTEFKNDAVNIVEQIKTKKDDIEKIVSDVRAIARDYGISEQAKFFQNEANSYKSKSIWWFIGTIVCAVITIIWAVHQFATIPTEKLTTPAIIQFTASRIIVLSVLYFLLVWFAKNYNAIRHNYVVNKHRQNALSTFYAFVDAASNDPEVKNAVLLQATKSIFSAQSSGYTSKDSDQDSSNTFFEIIRNIGIKGPQG